MLNSIELGNFQGFKTIQEAEFKPLTLIYGPNAAGKSSIIRSLLMMKQTSKEFGLGALVQEDTGFVYEGSEVSLASFANVVHKHDVSQEVTFGFDLELASTANNNHNLRRKSTWRAEVSSIGYQWKISETEPVKNFNLKLRLRENGGEIGLYFTFAKQIPRLIKVTGVEVLIELFKNEPSYFGTDGNQVQLDLHTLLSDKKKKSPKDIKQNIEFLEKALSPKIYKKINFGVSNIFPEMTSSNTTNSRRGVREIEDMVVPLRSWQVIFDIVNYARQQAFVNFRQIQHIGPVREVLGRLSFAAAKDEQQNKIEQSSKRRLELEKVVSGWIEKLTYGRYRFESKYSVASELTFVGKIKSEVIFDNLIGTEVTFSDVGVGLSHIKPILEGLASALSNRAITLLIEQPELHLHPRMQADLADLLVEVIHKNPASQLIIETHSEPLLLRLQKLLRNKELGVDEISVLYVDQSKDPEYLGNMIKNLKFQEENSFNLEMPISFSYLRLEDLI